MGGRRHSGSACVRVKGYDYIIRNMGHAEHLSQKGKSMTHNTDPLVSMNMWKVL